MMFKWPLTVLNLFQITDYSYYAKAFPFDFEAERVHIHVNIIQIHGEKPESPSALGLILIKASTSNNPPVKWLLCSP
jgi:hypothetical protein